MTTPKDERFELRLLRAKVAELELQNAKMRQALEKIAGLDLCNHSSIARAALKEIEK